MKHYFLLIILSISTVSQAQKSIIGKWKIVSINNGELYYNFQKDSISIFSEFGETEVEPSRLNEIKSVTKMMYLDTKFFFDDEGNYKWEFMVNIETKGKYSVDEKSKIIKMNGENSFGETIVDEFPYELKDNYLEITVNFSERPGKYVLERI